MTTNEVKLREPQARGREATGKTKSTLIELLLKQSDMYLRDLPEAIRIPALDGNRADEVLRP